MIPHLFLDIDGVLNDNTFNGIDQRKTEILNSVLFKVPELKIVLSSAWRHYVIDGTMTLKGFEVMLRACGLRCAQRLVGHTEDNGADFDVGGRARLIQRYARLNGIERFVAVDDMALELPETHFVRTNGDIGITQRNADDLLAILRNAPRVLGEEEIDRFFIRREYAETSCCR